MRSHISHPPCIRIACGQLETPKKAVRMRGIFVWHGDLGRFLQIWMRVWCASGAWSVDTSLPSTGT